MTKRVTFGFSVILAVFQLSLMAAPTLAAAAPVHSGGVADLKSNPARTAVTASHSGRRVWSELLGSELLAALAATAGENECFAYSYDRNGNRTALNAVTYSGAGTWGSSAYGCFTWSQP